MDNCRQNLQCTGIVLEIYVLFFEKHPTLSKIMKFVDLNEYGLERFESEKRTEEKRRKN